MSRSHPGKKTTTIDQLHLDDSMKFPRKISAIHSSADKDVDISRDLKDLVDNVFQRMNKLNEAIDTAEQDKFKAETMSNFYYGDATSAGRRAGERVGENAKTIDKNISKSNEQKDVVFDKLHSMLSETTANKIFGSQKPTSNSIIYLMQVMIALNEKEKLFSIPLDPEAKMLFQKAVIHKQPLVAKFMLEQLDINDRSKYLLVVFNNLKKSTPEDFIAQMRESTKKITDPLKAEECHTFFNNELFKAGLVKRSSLDYSTTSTSVSSTSSTPDSSRRPSNSDNNEHPNPTGYSHRR